MQYKMLDMSNYPRKAHFDYFRGMIDPFVGVTVNVDVSDLVEECKKKNRSFFLAFLHIAALAANTLPEFRQRISGESIIEYSVCGTSHIELTENGSYCYCTLRHQEMTWDEYFSYAKRQRGEALKHPSIEEADDVDSLLFISCLPWLNYIQLKQPIPSDDSNPCISWGKYEKDLCGRIMMPVTILAHHGIVDGVHIAEFYATLDRLLKENRGFL